MPTYFDSCAASKDDDGVVTVKVTYNDQVSQRMIEIVARRCSQYMYISPDAQTFIFDPNGRGCNEEYSDDEQEQQGHNDADDEDPMDWECVSSLDCYSGEYVCSDHRCVYCNIPYNETGTMPEQCCRDLMANGYSSLLSWVDGKCEVIDESRKCNIHDAIGSNNSCMCNTSSVLTTLNASGYPSRYCCNDDETKAECCAAIGGTWCDDSQFCIEAGASQTCEGRCAAYEAIENCTCTKAKQISITDIQTNTEIPYCCSPSDTLDQTCCYNAVGWWDMYNNYNGKCYSEKPSVCVRTWMPGQDYSISHVGQYMRTVQKCCNGEMLKQECCTRQGGYGCEEQELCSMGGGCISYDSMCMGPPQWCEHICEAHTKISQCVCSTYQISVVTPDATLDTKYCCDEKDGNFKQCCTALGFIWDGTGDNTGTCRTADPDVCIPYFDQLSSSSRTSI